MSSWERFLDTFFNAKVMAKYLPDIAYGTLVTVELAALVIVVAAAVASRQLEPRVHQAIVSRLSTSLESTVELGDTHLSFFPLGSGPNR